jgi:choline dehydrogenase
MTARSVNAALAGDSYDYVVVGAGSAGAALAARLAADPRLRIIVLEAGGWDRDPRIAVPALYYQAIASSRLNWRYATQPEPELHDRAIAWPRGKVVGGSSAINGMVYIRGQREDFEDWEAAGAVGWGWSGVEPYFKRLEGFAGGEGGRGRDGPLKISNISHPNGLSSAFVEACEALGFPRNEGFNGPRQFGAGLFELSVGDGLRCSTGRGYLRPLLGRGNLRVETQAHCDRVVFEDHRALGVRYVQHGQARFAWARREVVLCAGAIETPAILMRSGVGPADVIARAGGTPLVAAMGVGRNLQDHFQVRLVYRSTSGESLNVRRRQGRWLAETAIRFLANRNGPLTVGAGEAGLFSTCSGQPGRPEVQTHFIPFSTDLPGKALHAWDGYTLSVCQLRPESRGEVFISSVEPRARPKIVANYLSAEVDRAAVVAGIKLMRKVAAAAPLAGRTGEEVSPGPGRASDEDLLDYARATGGTIFHPCGTCAMGPQGVGVIGPDLKVHGVEGLRVADASVMPRIISGNTNAAAVMIGERAADLLLARSAGRLETDAVALTDAPRAEGVKAFYRLSGWMS